MAGLMDMFNNFNSMFGSGGAYSNNPAQQASYGGAQMSGLPQQIQGSNAPIYSTSGLTTPGTLDPALRATITGKNDGYLANGVNAFLGGAYQPTMTQTQGNVSTNTSNSGELFNLAKQFGMNTSGYGDFDDSAQYRYQNNAQNQALADNFYKQLGIANPGASNGILTNGDGAKGTTSLQADMQNQLKDYYSVSGQSGGWDGSGNTNALKSTVYKDNGQGQLVPVSQSRDYAANPSGYFKSGPGQDLLSAISTVAPAFGGVAGLANMAAPGAVGAVQGAIGTQLTNGLLNGVGNWALSGGNGGLGGLGTSLLGSAAGQIGSAAGNSLMGNSGGLGQLFGSGGTIGQSPIAGISSAAGRINPLLGNAASFLGGAGGNGISTQNLAQAGAGLAGSYLGRQLDPRLQGLGGTAGRSLASLFYR